MSGGVGIGTILRRSIYLVAQPPDGPVWHAATYLHRPLGWGVARKFSKFNRTVEIQLKTAPGALAYSLQRLSLGRDFWTLSLWTDRQSMAAIVGPGGHRLAADWRNTSGESAGKFAHWESPRPSLNFADPTAHLGSPPPQGRVLVAPPPIPAGWRRLGG